MGCRWGAHHRQVVQPSGLVGGPGVCGVRVARARASWRWVAHLHQGPCTSHAAPPAEATHAPLIPGHAHANLTQHVLLDGRVAGVEHVRAITQKAQDGRTQWGEGSLSCSLRKIEEPRCSTLTRCSKLATGHTRPPSASVVHACSASGALHGAAPPAARARRPPARPRGSGLAPARAACPPTPACTHVR